MYFTLSQFASVLLQSGTQLTKHQFMAFAGSAWLPSRLAPGQPNPARPGFVSRPMGTARRTRSLSCPLILSNIYVHFTNNGHGTPCPYILSPDIVQYLCPFRDQRARHAVPLRKLPAFCYYESMPFDREKHHRRSIRLKGFNYTQGNAFFVTICSYQKECIFGNISDGLMVLNEQGKCIEKAWLETAVKRLGIKLDEFIIMPNHFHGIIWIVDKRSDCLKSQVLFVDCKR